MVIVKKRHTKNFSLRRGYTHQAVRGSEQKMRCAFCSKSISKYKAVPMVKRFSPNILIKEGVMDIFSVKNFACPSCAKIHHLKRQTEAEKEKSKTGFFRKKSFSKSTKEF